MTLSDQHGIAIPEQGGPLMPITRQQAQAIWEAPKWVYELERRGIQVLFGAWKPKKPT